MQPRAGAHSAGANVARLEQRAIAALIRFDRQGLETLAGEAAALAARRETIAANELPAAVETHRLLAAVLAHSGRNLRLLSRRHRARLHAAMSPGV